FGRAARAEAPLAGSRCGADARHRFRVARRIALLRCKRTPHVNGNGRSLPMSRQANYAPVGFALDDRSEQPRRAAELLEHKFTQSTLPTSQQRAEASRMLFATAPELESIWTQFASSVRTHGAALISGFPVESDVLFVLLCAALGEPATTQSGAL